MCSTCVRIADRTSIPRTISENILLFLKILFSAFKCLGIGKHAARPRSGEKTSWAKGMIKKKEKNKTKKKEEEEIEFFSLSGCKTIKATTTACAILLQSTYYYIYDMDVSIYIYTEFKCDTKPKQQHAREENKKKLKQEPTKKEKNLVLVSQHDEEEQEEERGSGGEGGRGEEGTTQFVMPQNFFFLSPFFFCPLSFRLQFCHVLHGDPAPGGSALKCDEDFVCKFLRDQVVRYSKIILLKSFDSVLSSNWNKR